MVKAVSGFVGRDGKFYAAAREALIIDIEAYLAEFGADLVAGMGEGIVEIFEDFLGPIEQRVHAHPDLGMAETSVPSFTPQSDAGAKVPIENMRMPDDIEGGMRVKPARFS